MYNRYDVAAVSRLVYNVYNRYDVAAVSRLVYYMYNRYDVAAVSRLDYNVYNRCDVDTVSRFDYCGSHHDAASKCCWTNETKLSSKCSQRHRTYADILSSANPY